jgi:hypothetical protein
MLRKDFLIFRKRHVRIHGIEGGKETYAPG